MESFVPSLIVPEQSERQLRRAAGEYRPDAEIGDRPGLALLVLEVLSPVRDELGDLECQARVSVVDTFVRPTNRVKPVFSHELPFSSCYPQGLRPYREESPSVNNKNSLRELLFLALRQQIGSRSSGGQRVSGCPLSMKPTR